MFILTNVYPASVIKMLQMAGRDIPNLLVTPVSREHQLLPVTAEPPCTAHLVPASKIVSLQGLDLLFAINIQRQDEFQMFLCFKILMYSLSFNFLYIIKKTPVNLAFWGLLTSIKQWEPFLLISSTHRQLYRALSY